MKNHLAFDIGGTTIKYAVLTPARGMIEQGECPTPYDGVQALADTLTGMARPHLHEIRGIAISLPGTIVGDADGTILRGGSLMYMDNVPLGRLMREATGLPCAVENDGYCCALGEYAGGALRGSAVGVALVLGTGIGGGIIMNGRVFRGTHNFAGEFSYLISDPAKLPDIRSLACAGCGSAGLKAAVTGAMGLPYDAELDGVKIFELANAGDAGALVGLRYFARQVAMVIYNLQAVLDPDVFALGGGISSQPLLLQLVREAIAELHDGLPLKPPLPHVTLCEHGNAANLFGAVYAWQQQYEPAAVRADG